MTKDIKGIMKLMLVLVVAMLLSAILSLSTPTLTESVPNRLNDTVESGTAVRTATRSAVTQQEFEKRGFAFADYTVNYHPLSNMIINGTLHSGNTGSAYIPVKIKVVQNNNLTTKNRMFFFTQQFLSSGSYGGLKRSVTSYIPASNNTTSPKLYEAIFIASGFSETIAPKVIAVHIYPRHNP